MKFGEIPLDEAEGAILAHSVPLFEGYLQKGKLLTPSDIEALRCAGKAHVMVARLFDGDLDENTAARRLGDALIAPGLRLGQEQKGRANLIAETPGILRLKPETIHAANCVDEGLTLATLPDYMSVRENQLVATIKIIPYGVPEQAVVRVEDILNASPLALHPYLGGTAQLILTQTPDTPPNLLTKAETVLRKRLEKLRYKLGDVVLRPHNTAEIAASFDEAADIILILGASACSDRADIAPSALHLAGGEIIRFGMPVDPGNLLFLGSLQSTPVVGLPGCARSPALNGVDWVLERLAAGLHVTGRDIAEMGVGGLLKEMPNRPQPRQKSGV